MCETNPILREFEVCGEKRTQPIPGRRPGERGTRVRLCRTNPICHPACRDQRDPLRQTKPISRRGRGSGVRNKANFRWDPKGRAREHLEGGQVRKTKPRCDLRRGAGISPVNQDHGQDAHATAPSVAKQSQFWAGLPDGGKTGSHEGLETGNLGSGPCADACDRRERR